MRFLAVLGIAAALIVPATAQASPAAQDHAQASPRPASASGIDTAALGHDSHSTVYRTPTGTVAVGHPVLVRFRTESGDLDRVLLRVTDEANTQRRIPMRVAAHDISCYDPALSNIRCDFWQATVTPRQLGTLSYRFVAEKGQQLAYYGDQPALFGGLGVVTDYDEPNNYRIHAVAANFPTPPSMRSGLMYQIFPDRFADGDPGNSPSTTAPRYDYPAPPGATDEQKAAAAKAQITHRSWDQYPEGHCRDYVDTPCSEEALGRDYFGGDLQGVTAKLGYLQNLGVTMIYLNPVFASASDHAYDVRDFRHIDPAFGGDAALRTLLDKAHARHMRVILDLPYDPTSSDSPYFDRYHHFGTVGACESTESPYRSWFTFHDLPAGQDGPCAGSTSGVRATYDSWGGTADALPLLRKADPDHPDQPYAPVAQAFYRGPNSITAHWLNFGVDGFRLDSMQDTSFPKS
ncbi:MAG TPA: alpha-amylase family glycosyl hydrolase [Mycobacteriales bacterium]|nr:alpha-amylase family glycosyl hydrolase [Mycobacteriales bacterium]